MQADVIHLNLPASSQYLNVLNACIAEMIARTNVRLDGPETITNIQLAVQETCTNIINYAYVDNPQRLKIILTFVPDMRQLTIDLFDTATEELTAYQFVESNITAPDEPNGYSLWLMRQLLDEVIYCSCKGQTWRSEDNGPWYVLDETIISRSAPGNWWQLVKRF